MSETIVNILESIEIDKQHADVMSLPSMRLSKRGCEMTHEQRPVPKPRQGIVRCIVVQPLFGQLFVRNVLDLEDQISRAGIGFGRRRNAPRRPNRASRFMHVSMFHLAAGRAARSDFADLYKRYAQVVRRDHRLKVA